MTEAVHGGLDQTELAALGIDPNAVLDFSTNVNPFGPAESVRAAIAEATLDSYPDRDALLLRKVLSEHLGIPADRILPGNGASELVQLVALAFLRPGDTALIIGPTYAEYARVTALMGAKPHSWLAPADMNFAIDIDEVTAALRATHPRVCFVCNPNNPTGTLLPADAICHWLSAFPQTLFVVDEAYLEFVAQAQSLVTESRPNLIVLRSLTKAYGLAGLRLGFAVAPPHLIAALRRVRFPWSVSSPAQAAGIAALRDRHHLNQSLLRLHAAKQALVPAILALPSPLAGEGSGVRGREFPDRLLHPWRLLPSPTNFFLLEVGNATALRNALLTCGLLVRDCTSFGLPHFIRLSSRDQPDNGKLVAALHTDRQIR